MNNNVEAESVMPGALDKTQFPEGWELRRLKHVGSVLSGTGFPHEYQGVENEVLPFLKVSDMSTPGSEKWISHAANSISRETANELGASIIPESSIVYAKIGAALLLNKRRVLRKPSCIDNNMSAFVPNAVIPEWALWWMSTLDFGEYVNPGAIPSFTEGQQKELPFFVPPLETQRLIADYLDRETARIDALVAEKEKMLALLEEKRAALISRAVTYGLNPDTSLKPSNAPWFDETPFSWSVERLKWVIKSVDSGVSVNASDQAAEGDSFGVLKTSAVAGGTFFPSENKSAWDTEYDRLACPVTKNTIIMSRMNTPNLVGESGYVAEDYPTLFLPDRLWQISFDENRVFVPFMSLLLASKEARHALSSMATGTSPSMKNLAIEEMSSLLIPVPTIDEQKLIYSAVARQDAMIGPLKNDLTASLQLLKERRAALITAAVTGRIPIEAMRS